jgi:hypothetical protein
LKHLLLNVKNYGVIAFNIENLSQPIGILALGSDEWMVTHNNTGNVIVTNKSREASEYTHIFKISRI